MLKNVFIFDYMQPIVVNLSSLWYVYHLSKNTQLTQLLFKMTLQKLLKHDAEIHEEDVFDFSQSRERSKKDPEMRGQVHCGQ